MFLYIAKQFFFTKKMVLKIDIKLIKRLFLGKYNNIGKFMKIKQKLNTNTFTQSQFISQFNNLAPTQKSTIFREFVEEHYQLKREFSSLLNMMEEIIKKIQNPKHNEEYLENILSEDAKPAEKLMSNSRLKKLFQDSWQIAKQKPENKGKKRQCCDIEEQVRLFCSVIKKIRKSKQIQKYEDCKYLHSRQLYKELHSFLHQFSSRNSEKDEENEQFNLKFGRKYSQKLNQQTQYSQKVSERGLEEMYPWKRKIKNQIQTTSFSVQTQQQETELSKMSKMIENSVKQYQNSTNYITRNIHPANSELLLVFEKIQKNKQKKILKQIRQLFPELPTSYDETVYDQLVSLANIFNNMTSKFNRKIEQLLREKQNISSQSQLKIKEIEKSVYFCQSSILPFVRENFSTEDHSFLFSILQKYEKRSLKKFNLLYKFQPDDLNSHSCVDGHERLLFLLKLNNDRILGAYSQMGFQRNSTYNPGFIFSFTEKQQYHLAEKYKSKPICAYDDFFLIFGNSDLRVKMGEKKVYSNFGCETSFVRGLSGSEKVHDLLGEGKQREVELKSYEFYQVIFD